jgi:hypothetical protein
MSPDPEGASFDDGQPRPPWPHPRRWTPALLAQAVAAAQAADVVVAVVGDTLALIGEARSTATLELFGAQNALLDALAATGKPMVVVLLASKPQVLPPGRDGCCGHHQRLQPAHARRPGAGRADLRPDRTQRPLAHDLCAPRRAVAGVLQPAQSASTATAMRT